MSRVIHALVAKTAKEICASVWEVCSSNDKFHQTYPKVRPFVQRFWGDFVGHARESLVKMLQPVPGTENDPAGPTYKYTQHVRDEVFEALVVDGVNKTPAPVDIHQLRANAGFAPLSEVRGGRVLH